MDVIQKLSELMIANEGVCSIFFTDFDGSQIISVGDSPRFKSSLISGHLNCIGQVPKLLMGEHKSSYFHFDSSQLAVHTVGKYFAFVHAGITANTGGLLNMREKLASIAEMLMHICPPDEAWVEEERPEIETICS